MHFTKEDHITALKNLIAQKKPLDYFDYKYIARIDNKYQVEATKYIDACAALDFKNKFQIDALKNLIAQGQPLDYLDYKYIAKIDNHCQSDAIEAGHSLSSILHMQCAGMADHLDF